MSDSHKQKGGGHGPSGGGSHEEHEGAPEWLISFADNVALMMGFFVVLLAMNMKPTPPPVKAVTAEPGEESSAAGAQPSTTEMLDWAISIRDAFNNPVRPDDPRDAVLYQRVREKQAEALTKRDKREGTEHNFQTLRRSDYFGMGGTVEFEAGVAELNAISQTALAGIVAHRRGLANVIDVRGHVSAAEAHEQPDRGMELSYRRAKNTAEAMVAMGIDWKRIRVVACADADRVIKKTYDAAGHRANQRVELIDTDRSAGEDNEPPTSAPAPNASATPSSEPHCLLCLRGIVRIKNGQALFSSGAVQLTVGTHENKVAPRDRGAA